MDRVILTICRNVPLSIAKSQCRMHVVTPQHGLCKTLRGANGGEDLAALSFFDVGKIVWAGRERQDFLLADLHGG